MSERGRQVNGSHGGNATDEPGGSSVYQLSLNQHQQQARQQFTPLAADPSPLFADCSRLLDTTLERSCSITDTDKLQQQGHEHLAGTSYHGNSYRGDNRIPSRYSADAVVDPVFRSTGRYATDRSWTGFQRCFHGDVSAAPPSHSRRLPWSETSRSQVYLHYLRCSLTKCADMNLTVNQAF